MAATTGALTAVLAAACIRATRRLPLGRSPLTCRSSTRSVETDVGRIVPVELFALLRTKTREDFLRPSASLRAGAGAGALATGGVGGGGGATYRSLACRYASRAGSPIGGTLARVGGVLVCAPCRS